MRPNSESNSFPFLGTARALFEAACTSWRAFFDDVAGRFDVETD